MKPEDKAAWLQACNEWHANSGGKDLGEYMFEAALAHRDAQPTVAQGEPITQGVALVQVTGSLDEIDSQAWPFINEEARKVGAENGRIETYQYALANGVVIVLWDGPQVHAMAVTIRDELNHTRCVRMLADKQQAPAVAVNESVAVNEQDRLDAARYRWLRDSSVPPHNFYLSVPVEFDGVKYTPQEVDNYIDAAAKAAKGAV